MKNEESPIEVKLNHSTIFEINADTSSPDDSTTYVMAEEISQKIKHLIMSLKETPINIHVKINVETERK